jgi:hypothetical protein
MSVSILVFLWNMFRFVAPGLQDDVVRLGFMIVLDASSLAFKFCIKGLRLGSHPIYK